MSRRFIVMLAGFGASMLGACATHAYGTPVVTRVQVAPDQQVDVAWVVEDGVRVLRCVNGPDRPQCRRAQVD
jgi:hypothetical protein